MLELKIMWSEGSAAAADGDDEKKNVQTAVEPSISEALMRFG